jgi:hypothetical protein
MAFLRYAFFFYSILRVWRFSYALFSNSHRSVHSFAEDDVKLVDLLRHATDAVEKHVRKIWHCAAFARCWRQSLIWTARVARATNIGVTRRTNAVYIHELTGFCFVQ